MTLLPNLIWLAWFLLEHENIDCILHKIYFQQLVFKTVELDTEDAVLYS